MLSRIGPGIGPANLGPNPLAERLQALLGPGGLHKMPSGPVAPPVRSTAGLLSSGRHAAGLLHPGAVSPLQELIAHLRGGHMGGSLPGLHGGGGVHGSFPSPAHGGPVNAHTLLGLGNTAAAAQLWEQRHPLAMAGGAGIPDWVAQFIASQTPVQAPGATGY